LRWSATSGRLARLERGANLARNVIGHTEPRGGKGVRCGAHPLTQVQVIDRPVQVIGQGPAHGPGDQFLGQPSAQLHGTPVVGHIRPAGQSERLIEAPRPRGLFRLSQHDSPLSQHDGLAVRIDHGGIHSPPCYVEIREGLNLEAEENTRVPRSRHMDLRVLPIL